MLFSHAAACVQQLHQIGRVVSAVKLEELITYIDAVGLRHVDQSLGVSCAKLVERMLRRGQRLLELETSPHIVLHNALGLKASAKDSA